MCWILEPSFYSLTPHTHTSQVVHSSSKYSHPSNWAGYLLMGNDIILRDRSTELAKSFQSMLQAPLDYLIATLRTLQSMVSAKVTSLQVKTNFALLQ